MSFHWIDSHCHLHYDYSPKSSLDLVNEARTAGVESLITVGTDLKTLEQVQQISESDPSVFHTVGVHPHEASNTLDIERLANASHHKKCVAIGEIGLDYYYEHSPRLLQIEVLEKQLDLAIKCQKPVVIHSRDAEEDLLNALKVYARSCSSDLPAIGVIHCFTGSPEFGKACLDLGFYISFSGILTFKNATEVRENAKVFPLDRLMVETDSPYLAPVPYRGKKCEPFMLVQTGKTLAEIKTQTVETVAQVTSANARKVFHLPKDFV